MALREIQYAIRRLRGSPMFTIAAILTLALAIGATASVFGVVDGVLLKAFPFHDPDRVLIVWESSPERHIPQWAVSPLNYLDWRDQNSTFTALAAARGQQVTVITQREPDRVAGLAVTPNYFSVVGVAPILGRSLSPDSGGPSEVVISYGYWRRRLGASPSAIGQTVALDDRAYTVVGVMPAGMPGPAELWTRLTFTGSDLNNRAGRQIAVYGRLKPGVTEEQAQTEMQTIAGRLAQAYPKANESWSVVMVPLLEQLVGKIRLALIMLLSAAGCVLLIGVANLANLFLVRFLAREREMAVRTALGATRGRLMRELMAEAVILGFAAAAVGVGIAVGGVQALRALAPPALPRLNDVGVDGLVVAFCVLAAMATVATFAGLPAWLASSGNLVSFLKEGGRATGSTRHNRLQDGLVVLQVAVALVLLTGAGLLLASFEHFRRMDPGFRPEGVLTARIALDSSRYSTPERQVSFIAASTEQLATLPGVELASASDALPGNGANILPFAVVGEPPPDPEHLPAAYAVGASPEYFRTMGIRILSGRGVLPTDDYRAAKVAVVDELLAHRVFGSRDPVGRRLVFSEISDTLDIVGVVATVKQGGLATNDLPTLYAPFAQWPARFVSVAVRTSGDPKLQTVAVKRAIAGIDPNIPVSDVKTMSDRMAQSVGTTRFSTFLASLFAVVALILGAVGIYSVLAYVVSQRQREIAIRIALGASRSKVISDVLIRALTLSGTGIALGSFAAWVLTRGLAGLFLGVSPHNPAIFAGAAAVFAVVALAAASVPAFRTTRINPVVALTSS